MPFLNFLQTIKYKKVFWTYIVVSFVLLLASMSHLDSFDKTFNEHGYYHTKEVYEQGLIGSAPFAAVMIAILVSYVVTLMFLSVKYIEYKKHINRYKPFTEYPLKEQAKHLNSIHCDECKQATKQQFNHEKMIDGMHWIYTNCTICQQANKLRID